jgi:predicted RNase H-like nuclease (RuvC/YqgF family)
MGGISMKNFSMFRKLCGDNALKNVVIVTNRWGEVDPQVGEEREAELARDDAFFKPVFDRGGKMARHEDTVPSAERIIRLILKNHPLPLWIQDELVIQGKNITETDAGEELNRELNAQIRKHQQEMQVLMDDMQQAMEDKDEETRRELEIETQRMKSQIERLENDSKRLKSDYEKEKERVEARMQQVESEAKKEAERAAARYQQHIDAMKNHLRTNGAVSAHDPDKDGWITIPIYE